MCARASLLLLLLIALPAAPITAQTNFVYDQQSAVEGAAAEGGGTIPLNQPLGQSFVPTGLASIWWTERECIEADMKKLYYVALFLLLSFCLPRLLGQTNFVYDQQSAVEGAAAEGGGVIPNNQPLGQSFIPDLNFIDFVRLRMDDGRPGNTTGAVVYVDLLSNSITGTVLASSLPVFLPDSFGTSGSGYPNFFFSNSVPLTPGATYLIRPTLQSGDPFFVVGDVTYKYSNGTAFYNGSAFPLQDLWFREGIIGAVPEPSSVCLGLAGAGALGWWRWRKRRFCAARP